MMPPPPRAPLQVTLDHHLAGRVSEAEAIYRDVLARDAGDVGANFLLGALFLQTDRNADAPQPTDRPAFVRDLETAYRQMWREKVASS